MSRTRLLFGLAGIVAGISFGFRWLNFLKDVADDWLPNGPDAGQAFFFGGLLGAAVLFGIVGFILGPVIVGSTMALLARAESKVSSLSGGELAAGASGAVLGLLIAFLLGSSLAYIPVIGPYLPTAASLGFGYLGWAAAVKRREDLRAWIGGLRRGREAEPGRRDKYLDTSAVIDGRIADLARTGFLEGRLLVPSFVLDELRHVADSNDPLKRNRGRRGLDLLNRMQKELPIPVEVVDHPLPPGEEADRALVQVAAERHGTVITNDFNLHKVALLQGVPVLNINDLANALKPAFVAGESLLVQVIKDGKEPGQGVAYLEDGTMIVVEGGQKYVGRTLRVEVTSVLQTSAGRMLFARPRLESGSSLRGKADVS